MVLCFEPLNISSEDRNFRSSSQDCWFVTFRFPNINAGIMCNHEQYIERSWGLLYLLWRQRWLVPCLQGTTCEGQKCPTAAQVRLGSVLLQRSIQGTRLGEAGVKVTGLSQTTSLLGECCASTCHVNSFTRLMFPLKHPSEIYCLIDLNDPETRRIIYIVLNVSHSSTAVSRVHTFIIRQVLQKFPPTAEWRFLSC